MSGARPGAYRVSLPYRWSLSIFFAVSSGYNVRSAMTWEEVTKLVIGGCMRSGYTICNCGTGRLELVAKPHKHFLNVIMTQAKRNLCCHQTVELWLPESASIGEICGFSSCLTSCPLCLRGFLYSLLFLCFFASYSLLH